MGMDNGAVVQLRVRDGAVDGAELRVHYHGGAICIGISRYLARRHRYQCVGPLAFKVVFLVGKCR
jgi:hypothetical protein